MNSPDKRPSRNIRQCPHYCSCRSKRGLPSDEGGGWECSVCTFRNAPEAFKCDMCDTRKGTSTRKPRMSQQQVIIHQVSVQQTKKEKPKSIQRIRRPARLKNIDRSTAQHMVVTVGDVTVIITDYRSKTGNTIPVEDNTSNSDSDSNSNA